MIRSDIINILIDKFKLNTYLEIGVRKPNENFNLINANVKLGVDPSPEGNVTHKMTSDEFFKNNEWKFDIIFVDGMHTKDQSFTDIYNSMEVLNDGGFIVVHDCNPPIEYNTRSYEEYLNTGGEWNGEVYKGFIYSRALNPSWNFFTVNADFGCGIITKNKEFPNSKQLFDFWWVHETWEALTWEYFDMYRKYLLNLISEDQFKRIVYGE